jgi:SAM-dependent methyltransferase
MRQPPFDEVAEKFTRATDDAIRENRYTRGTLILELAEQTIPPGGQVLDFGCGPGRMSLLLAQAGFRVRGVDISEGMIRNAYALCRDGLHLEFQAIDDAAEALTPASCDAIVCSSVIEYVRDPDKLLQQFRAALRNPGALIISYANRSSLCRWCWGAHASRNPMYVPHHRAWHGRGFRKLLARNGFRTIIRPKYYDFPYDWVPGAWLLRRVSLAGALGVLAARPTNTS